MFGGNGRQHHAMSYSIREIGELQESGAGQQPRPPAMFAIIDGAPCRTSSTVQPTANAKSSDTSQIIFRDDQTGNFVMKAGRGVAGDFGFCASSNPKVYQSPVVAR
jgi:hypothetical protein